VIHFLGIGAQRCGTTWLYSHLRRHPHVSFPAGKEVHFWDREADRGAAQWLKLFPRSPANVHQGEITPAYAILERDVIARIRDAAPQLRIFYSVRNPMERAWSSARLALRRAEMREEEASDQWFLDHFRSSGSRRRGAYAACLDAWQSVFPREQLLLIVFDDIVREPLGVLGRLAAHLGIEAAPFAERTLDKAVHGAGSAAMRPALLDALRDLYAGEIAALSARLGRDLSAWLEWQGGSAGSPAAGVPAARAA
jgi:hypothetical protein